MPSKKKEYRSPEKVTSDDARSDLDPERIPRHVAIIMDGNGRWAKAHGLKSRIQGHRAGIKSVRETVEAAAELGIKVLSLYAFSKENWLRPENEVNTLMKLLSRFIDKELQRLLENNIKLTVSGDIKDLPVFARDKINDAIKATAPKSHMTLNLCLSYGGRDEIVRAARRISRRVARGKIKPEQVDKELFAGFLYHPELGEPDLLIRTSGELRISNFLLWQIAYTEIYVTPVLWPDFRREHLVEALKDYQRRQRRFGKVIED